MSRILNSTDITAAGATSQSLRKKVTLLVLGQSTEQGPIPLSDKATYPNAFVSQRNPGMFAPRGLIPVVDRGGWWAKVYDDMWDWGYDLDIVNAAIGGVSALTHITGFVQGRANSTPYYQKRTNTNFPDLGDFGDVITFSSKSFNVTAGRKRQCYNSTPHPGVVGTSTWQDFIAFSQTAELSASSAPDVSATAVGQTVADGTLMLTCIDSSRFTSEGTFYPGNGDITVNSGLTNYNLGGVIGERNAGFGFDPLGYLSTAYRLATQSHSELKIVWFSHGQSDLGTGATTLQRCWQIIANFFLRRGWTVVIGNTIYSPAAANATTANYNAQVTAADNAVTSLAAYYPDKVYRGANLYNTLGSTGVMGGQHCTGGTGGTSSNTLTISAVTANRGTGIAVGQNVWNGTTLVGVISALGTGIGGTGTYVLDRAATITNGTTLICAGSGLQYDGVHQNGSVVAAGGSAISGSLKEFLPQRAL